MIKQATSRVAAALALAFVAGCVPHEDPTAPDRELHLVGFDIQGADQTTHEGDTLPERVVGSLKLSDGSYDVTRTVHVTILSGSGGIFLHGARGWGNGVTLYGSGAGSLGVGWILGPADEAQALRFWALGNDTVYADVHATSLPREGG